MHRAVLALCCAGLGALPLQAQDAPRLWIDQLYPFFYYSSVDGFWLGGHYGWSSPMTDPSRPEPHYADLRLDASASTQGSYRVAADAQAPAWWKDWRVGLTLTAARANRLGYYGLGNATPFTSDSVTSAAPYFYRVSRTSQSARLTAQRRVDTPAGQFRVLVGGTLERSDFRVLPGDNLFRRDRAGGALRAADVPFTDAVVRVGLVFDSRDQEVDPHRGVFAEALVGWGRGYTRATGAIRAYVHPIDRLILAARIGAERMSGTPPAAALFTIESSEGPAIALGGYRSLRGYHDARFLGPGKLVGGVEARYAPIWAPRVLEIKLVAFYDVGRVFGPASDAVRLTTDELHQSGGFAVALSLLRNTLIVVGGGKGSEGAQVLVGTRWSY